MINIDSIINTALDTKYQYGKSSGFPKWLTLDWTNDYWLQFPYLNWYGSFVKNDWTRNYIECRNGWVDAIGYNPPMNSKSTWMYKFVWMVEEYSVTRTFRSWTWYTTFTVNSTWKVEVEMQWGAWSMRVTSTNSVTIWSIVCCVIRINTNDTWWTRAVGDVDIWITSTKETKWFTATWNNSSTWTYWLWGSYNSTPLSPRYGRLYRAVAWSWVAPSDAECAAEQASPWSEVYWTAPTFLLTADNVNNRAVWNSYWRDAFVRWLYDKWTDADWNYIEFWGTYDRNLLTWFNSWITTNSNLNLSQADSFVMKSKFKVMQFNPNNVMWVFGANFNFGMFLWNASWVLQTWARTWWTITAINAITVSLNTIYDVALERNARDKKLYTWINWVCINPAWMSFTTTFSITTNLNFWYSAILWWNDSSGRIRMYHSRIMIWEFTDDEMVADYNLGNNLPNTDRLVLEWRPEWFKNEPLIYKETNLTWSWWSSSSATVTANYWTFADWVTSTSRITSTAWTAFNVAKTVSSFGWITVNGAWMAWRTFYRKVWIRTRPWASTSQKIRLSIWQNSIQDFISTDYTINDWRSEISRTATLNAWTTATALLFRIVSATTLEAVDIEVGCTLCWVSNEFCYDYSPDCKPGNIGRFTPWTIALNYKPGRDWTNASNSEIAVRMPRCQLHLRDTTNNIQWRTDPTAWARVKWYTLWSWFRSPVHITATRSIDQTTNFTKLGLFIDWVPTTDNQNLKNLFVDSTLQTNVIQIWNNGSPYTMAKMRDIKILKWVAWQTEAQQLKQWITPSNMELYAWYGPGNSEAGNTVLLDQSWNNRHIKLVNGAQIDYQQII